MTYNCTGCKLRDDIILCERNTILFFEEHVKILQVEIDYLNEQNTKLKVAIQSLST